MRLIKRIGVVVSVLPVFGARASAALTTFSGEDLNAGPGSTHPLSTAAAANFDAATAATPGAVSLITFEAAPVGAFSTLSVAPGVTLSGVNYLGSNQQILSSPSFPASPQLGGFDTTAGGANYADSLGGSLTFTFATPIQSFGAYLTGVQTVFYADVVQFSDGTAESVTAPGTGTSTSAGALDFVGFTDPGKSITSVTINAGPSSGTGADEIGVDDVRYQAVPEPTGVGLTAAAAGAVSLGRRRRPRGRTRPAA